MQSGAITSYIDVAQLTLYLFWGFFFGLVLYLHRENKREGYPLVNRGANGITVEGFPPVPAPKEFLLHDGTVRYAPRDETAAEVFGEPSGNFPGAPFDPAGNPMLSGMGAGAWAERPDVPDTGFDDHLPKIVPLRAAGDFFLAWEDPDPRGMVVLGGDGMRAGTIADVWVDRSEVIIRYLEVALDAGIGAGTVLLPMTFADISGHWRRIRVAALMAAQFADVPKLKNPDSVTFLEEEKITAYYGGGMLYAKPSRNRPLL
jgi:photosynthetic reaction center H subunit